MKHPKTVRQILIDTIIKRDGLLAPFDQQKITTAVEKAMRAAGEFKTGGPEKIALAVTEKLTAAKQLDAKFVPTVEGVQDLGAAELMARKFPATAKAYILYR